MESGFDSQTHHCGFCKSELPRSPAISIETSALHYFRCPSCQSLFLLPLPSAEVLAAAYSSDYYGGGESKFISPIENTIERFRMGRARRIASRFARGARVLDVGCGNGRFLKGLHQLGFTIEGVELPGPAASRAEKVEGLQLHLGKFEQLPLPEQSYDAVTLWHVYEHLAEPRSALARVHALLAPQGILGISFPNASSFQGKFFGAHWFHLDPPRHLFLPSTEGFLVLAKELGFELIEVRHFSLEQNVYSVLQSLLNLGNARRDVFYEFLKGRRGAALGISQWSLISQFLLACLFLPFSFLVAMGEAAAGQGATLEFLLRKK